MPSRVAIQALRPLRYTTPAETTPDWLLRPGGGRDAGLPNPTGYLRSGRVCTTPSKAG
jgi:hypothetical protein